jgi:hypothetical protein
MVKDVKIDGEFPELPQDPVDALVNPLKRFLHIESASGFLSHFNYTLCSYYSQLASFNQFFGFLENAV